MGPTETLQDVTEGYYKKLKREGLNPFDLLSWQFLTNLYIEITKSGRRGDFNDRDVHQRTKQAIWAALERKGEAIDLETQDDACDQELTDLRNL